MELIRITDLSQKLGITSRSLRYYEEAGLIESVRPEGEKYRYYAPEAVERLRQILVLRKMQIPVKDILRVYESADDLAPDIAPEDRVMGASVVNWLDEYRCFVKDNAVLTVSKYAQSGELALAGTSDELAEATEYATGILRSPAVGIVKSSVIDVGRIAGVGWAVVEANPTWASGLYECDPSQALDAVAWAFGIQG